MKKLMELNSTEKKDCIMNARNRKYAGKKQPKSYPSVIGSCDSLVSLVCKDKGDCPFYKSCEEWIRVSIASNQFGYRGYPRVFKLNRIHKHKKK